MKCKFIKMRRAGVDIPKLDLKHVGDWSRELVIMDIREDGMHRYVRVAKHTSQSYGKPLVAVLYEPHIIWMNEGRFTLAGFERVMEGEKIVHYAQSWLCTVEGTGDT